MSEVASPPEQLPAPPPRSLGRDSVARFLSDGSGLVLGTIAGVITARWLGPSGKGTLAALTFVTILLVQACSLGLGDAAVVRVGQGKATLQEALSASLGTVLLTTLAGTALLLLYSVAQLPLDDPFVLPAVAAACATLFVSGTGQLLLYIVYARQQIVTMSVVIAAMSAVTTLGIVLFCVVIDLAVFGAVLASFVAACLGLAIAATLLLREGLHFRLRLDRSYLRPAVSFGVRTQTANILALAAARVDLLVVYLLAGSTEAGYYSAALTLGTITGFVALALSYASFPGMAQLGERAALALTTKLMRASLALGTALALLLLALVPFLIPLLLGRSFTPAVVPALLLLVGNVLWGCQWLLARATAARGDASLVFRSFGVNLATMIALDIALVPPLGALGAAVASVIAPLAGLVVCLRRYRRDGCRLRQFVPRLQDLREWSERAAHKLRELAPAFRD